MCVSDVYLTLSSETKFDIFCQDMQDLAFLDKIWDALAKLSLYKKSWRALIWLWCNT